VEAARQATLADHGDIVNKTARVCAPDRMCSGHAAEPGAGGSGKRRVEDEWARGMMSMFTIPADLRRVIGAAFFMPIFVSALLAIGPALAQAGSLDSASGFAPLVTVDWQPPLSLPPRFRNHCRYDANRSRVYCSNHCGIDYEFYYCSPASFGCCRRGYGYCDWRGRLRCAP
jgi:hypothetical protein